MKCDSGRDREEEKGTEGMGKGRRDSRVPIRAIDLGSVLGEVYEYADRTFVDLTVKGGGKLTLMLHELKSVALISLLLEREPLGKRL